MKILLENKFIGTFKGLDYIGHLKLIKQSRKNAKFDEYILKNINCTYNLIKLDKLSHEIKSVKSTLISDLTNYLTSDNQCNVLAATFILETLEFSQARNIILEAIEILKTNRKYIKYLGGYSRIDHQTGVSEINKKLYIWKIDYYSKNSLKKIYFHELTAENLYLLFDCRDERTQDVDHIITTLLHKIMPYFKGVKEFNKLSFINENQPLERNYLFTYFGESIHNTEYSNVKVVSYKYKTKPKYAEYRSQSLYIDFNFQKIYFDPSTKSNFPYLLVTPYSFIKGDFFYGTDSEYSRMCKEIMIENEFLFLSKNENIKRSIHTEVSLIQQEAKAALKKNKSMDDIRSSFGKIHLFETSVNVRGQFTRFELVFAGHCIEKTAERVMWRSPVTGNILVGYAKEDNGLAKIVIETKQLEVQPPKTIVLNDYLRNSTKSLIEIIKEVKRSKKNLDYALGALELSMRAAHITPLEYQELKILIHDMTV